MANSLGDFTKKLMLEKLSVALDRYPNGFSPDVIMVYHIDIDGTTIKVDSSGTDNLSLQAQLLELQKKVAEYEKQIEELEQVEFLRKKMENENKLPSTTE